jgi:predicted transcriptional regulator
MAQGWVCVHRQLLDNPIFKNDKLFRVFMFCLLRAQHAAGDQLVGDSVVHLKAGQLATGRIAISDKTGLSQQNVRTAISKLEKLGILTIKPTTKYSVITMINWEKYQQTNQQVTNKQPASNQQVTTSNNDNNDNNENKPRTESEIPVAKIIEVYNQECIALPKVEKWNSKQKRISQLKARWSEDKERQSIEWWRQFFAWCNTNESLNGSRFNWIADLEAITNQSKFTRLIEKGSL